MVQLGFGAFIRALGIYSPSFNDDDDDLFRDRNLSFVGLVYKFTEVMMIMRHVIATSHTNTLT